MDYAHVRVLVSFNGLKVAHESVMESSLAKRYEALGLLEVVDDGTREAGPGAVEPDAESGKPTGGGDGSEAGSREGEGSRARRHRKAPVVDQSGEA